MDSAPQHVIPLNRAAGVDKRLVGGKAAKLARLAQAGVRVPDGFCVTRAALGSYLGIVTAGTPEFDLEGVS